MEEVADVSMAIDFGVVEQMNWNFPSNLRKLTCAGDRDVIGFKFLENVKKLEYLEIQGWDVCLRHLEKQRSLKTLSLWVYQFHDENPITMPASVEHAVIGVSKFPLSLAQYKFSSGLKTLRINAEPVKFVAGLKRYPELVNLEIGSWDLDTTFRDLSVLGNCRNLESVIFRSCDLGSLKPLVGLMKLRKLSFIFCTSKDSESIGEVQGLTEISMEGLAVCKDLKAIQTLRNLQVLRLSSVALTDFDWLADFPPLRELRLCSMNTGGVSMVPLAGYMRRNPDCALHGIRLLGSLGSHS